MEKLLHHKISGGQFNNVPPLRSKMMGAIKAKGNKSTEKLFCLALLDAGITEWKTHEKMIGSPDIVFPLYKTVVFLDGCFWHRCPDCFRAPKTNPLFWKTKIGRNVERDARNNFLLKEQGFFVMRFWEHELEKNMEGCIESMKETLERNLLTLCDL